MAMCGGNECPQVTLNGVGWGREKRNNQTEKPEAAPTQSRKRGAQTTASSHTWGVANKE